MRSPPASKIQYYTNMIAINKICEWNVAIIKHHNRYIPQAYYGASAKKHFDNYNISKGIKVVAKLEDISEEEADLLFGFKVNYEFGDDGRKCAKPDDIEEIGDHYLDDLVSELNNGRNVSNVQFTLDMLYKIIQNSISLNK